MGGVGAREAPRAAWPAAAGRALSWRALLVGALLAVAYHRAFATLWDTWWGNENYSHGPLVPVVALFLAWRERRRLRAIPVAPDRRGLALVLAACAALVMGQRAGVFALQGYSLWLMAGGLVWSFAGVRWLRALAFPLGFLIFMLPFPPAFVNQLSFALKEFTVRLSSGAAQMLGVTLQREGMRIYLESGVLRIENPCSGLRSLISLLATGSLFAWLQPGGIWRKAALLGAAIPLAMVGNALRITALILVGHYAGVGEATGAFHDASGPVVFVAALAGLMGLRALLTPRAGRPAQATS